MLLVCPEGLPPQKGSVATGSSGGRKDEEDDTNSGIFQTKEKYLFVERAMLSSCNPSCKTRKSKE